MLNLSIIIVSFNTEKLTKGCIESVMKHTKGIKLEFIVIDNASKDGSVEMARKLSKKYPVKIIANKKNVGFGRANNQGMKRCQGRYFLLLNSDTVVKDNVLGEMISYLDENPKIGVATCALKNPDGSLQGTGGYSPNLFRVFAWMFFLDDIPIVDQLIKPFHPMHGQSPFYKGERFFKKAHQKDWLTGAFFLARSKLIEEVGYFDEDYFMYTEEVDYCYRIKRKDWQVWYLPKWAIVHLKGASSTAEFPILSEYKGIKLFYKKNKPSWQYPIMRLFLKGGALFRMIIFGSLKGKEIVVTYAKAFKIA